MKKKLVSLLSLILAVVMVFPVGVFADGEEGENGVVPVPASEGEGTEGGQEPQPPLDPAFEITCDKDAIFDTGTKNSATLSVPEADGVKPTKVTWAVDDETVFTVDSKGKLSALKAGSATVAAFVSYKDGEETRTKTISKTITITKNDVVSIDYTPAKTNTEYVVNQKITKDDLCIVATYADGSSAEITNYTYTPTSKLAKTNDKITVKLNGVEDLVIDITVADINVKDLIEKIEIIAPSDNKEFEVGSKLYKDDINIKLFYVGGTTSSITASPSDVKISGEGLNFANGYHTFSKDDAEAGSRTIKVEYAGFEDTVTIKIKAAEPETSAPSTDPAPETQKKVTVIMKTYPTKRNYKVGETFDATGMGLQVIWNSLDITNKSSTKVSYVPYTFVESDKTKTGIELTLTVEYNGEVEAAKLEVTGLTIGDAAAVKDDSTIKSLSNLKLRESAYTEGHIFTVDDIYSLYVDFNSGSDKTIRYDELDDYAFFTDENIAVEVVDKDGDPKTATALKKRTIEADDIYTDDDGDAYVYVRLKYNYTKTSGAAGEKTTDPITVAVEEAEVSYYYDGDLIAEYEDLEDALKYCNKDDEEWENFDLDDVKSSKYILLKVGKKFDITDIDDFSPYHNIVIDLNGHDLELDSDTFVVDKDDKEYSIIVKNSSKTAAKVIYDDKDLELVLAEDDSIEFKYGETLPGLYVVTVKYNKDEGTVTASPKLTSDKVEVGMGSDIKFTITPKTGYEIDNVKAGSKSVVTDKDNYSVSSSGVVTYTLKGVSDKTELTITFKAKKKAWNNPFDDVKETANYYSAVEFVYENELFKGTTNTTFSPSSTMTRAMFVTVLGRLSGMDDSDAVRKYGYDSDFTDVSSSNGRIKYAVPYIKWAVENGIVEGYGDGTFGPENEITHQQMYVMMYRYARFVEFKSDSISGVSLSSGILDRSSVADWATDAVKYAQKNDYLVFTNTTGSRIDPTGDAKRSELAMLLESFCSTVMGWAK